MNPDSAFKRILMQHALGPRFVGSPGHKRAQALLAEWLGVADTYREHVFVDLFFGVEVTCRNLWARFVGDKPGTLLFGTHYDTRPWADRDPNRGARRQPVPGANDGGSGVALLSELALDLRANRHRPTIDIVLFDAEDWHEIDGKEVSLGARRFVDDLSANDRPDAVIVVDMIAGRNLILDFDASAQSHQPSLELGLGLLQYGRQQRLPAFQLEGKSQPLKWIGCDHTPFRTAGIASTILIDIDYPPWHTVSDLPEACDVASLHQIGSLLQSVVFADAIALRTER